MSEWSFKLLVTLFTCTKTIKKFCIELFSFLGNNSDSSVKFNLIHSSEEGEIHSWLLLNARINRRWKIHRKAPPAHRRLRVTFWKAILFLLISQQCESSCESEIHTISSKSCQSKMEFPGISVAWLALCGLPFCCCMKSDILLVVKPQSCVGGFWQHALRIAVCRKDLQRTTISSFGTFSPFGLLAIWLLRSSNYRSL